MDNIIKENLKKGGLIFILITILILICIFLYNIDSIFPRYMHENGYYTNSPFKSVLTVLVGIAGIVDVFVIYDCLTN